MMTQRSRRWLLLAGLTASAAVTLAAAFHGFTRHPKSRRTVMRYEDGLAEYFKAGSASLRLMAQAHIGGFSERLPEWLKSAERKNPHLQAQARQQLFAALMTGNAETVDAALRGADPKLIKAQWALLLGEPSSPQWLDHALGLIIEPLILLGRGDLIPALHANSLRRLGAGAKSAITWRAAQELGAADEWDQALQVLDQARLWSADIDISRVNESMIWKYAYLHRRVDSVMPVLARMPFSADLKHLVEWRAWDLKAYQIRAGMTGIVVPVIEGEQPHGYVEAAAMQIAALADDPSSADLVRDLRRVLKPRTVEIIHADRGIALSSTNLPQAFSVAEAMIAARRKDYAKCAALARTPSDNILIDPPTVVIDALLDEGDWRAAADIAKDHDPRKRKLIKGFGEDRARQYVSLYTHLAFRAAWRGDDAAAAAFLAQAKGVAVEMPEDEGGGDDALFGYEAILAGISEGLLPRKYIYLFMDAFRSPY